MSEITDEKVKEIAEELISEHQAHQIVYLIAEDDTSIMTTHQQRREIAIESAKVTCLHILAVIPEYPLNFWTRVQHYLNATNTDIQN
jgi:hypothetical protein